MKSHPSVDTSEFSKELLVLTKLLGSHSKTIIESHFVDIDWNGFLNLAFHHRVYPILYKRLKEHAYDAIPTSVLSKLHSHYSANVIAMLRLSSEMEKINYAFSVQNLKFIVLKGPILALKLYGDISLRTSKDIDILVSPNDLTEAEEILIRLGYKTADKENSILNSWKRKHHHISYIHPENKTQIELHWRLSLELPGTSFEKLWRRKVTVQLSKSPVNFLGNEDLFIYLVSHGARHAWFRLRWLLDIDQMISKGMFEMSKVLDIYKQNKEQHLAGQAMIIAQELFFTQIPNDFKSLLFSKKSNEFASTASYFIRNKTDLSPNGDEDVLKRYKSYVQSLMTMSQKFQVLIDHFYPSYKDALTLPLPKQLHFLYFPLRPFLWIVRRMKQKPVETVNSHPKEAPHVPR